MGGVILDLLLQSRRHSLQRHPKQKGNTWCLKNHWLQEWKSGASVGLMASRSSYCSCDPNLVQEASTPVPPPPLSQQSPKHKAMSGHTGSYSSEATNTSVELPTSCQAPGRWPLPHVNLPNIMQRHLIGRTENTSEPTLYREPYCNGV